VPGRERTVDGRPRIAHRSLSDHRRPGRGQACLTRMSPLTPRPPSPARCGRGGGERQRAGGEGVLEPAL